VDMSPPGLAALQLRSLHPSLTIPLTHAPPLTNLPERLFVEERRPLKIIPKHPAREPS
jgi:hypothetical protein